MVDIKALADEFVAVLKDTAADVRIELTGDWEAVRDYTTERMKYLASIRNDPSFLECVEVEAVNILLMSAGEAVKRADALDERLQALGKGLLAMAARAIGIG